MKIGVVGCGHVGSAVAYACVLRGIGSEIVLIDKNSELASAQAADISHATPFCKPVKLYASEYDRLEGAAVTVIAAGVGQKPGETRLDLLQRNTAVFRDIILKILAAAPKTILLIATNPVDVMTYVANEIAQAESSPTAVIGTGTILDTARFKTLLGAEMNVSNHSIHANVLGEHGDSEVLHWSGVTIGSVPLAHYMRNHGLSYDAAFRERIDGGVRRAAYEIINGKGATWYGIGMGAARIIQAIEDDERAILTCSAPVTIVGIENVTMSMPRIVGRTGVIDMINPNLDMEESQALQKSASLLREQSASWQAR